MFRKYDVTHWSDFVRGQVAPSQNEAMRVALQHGSAAEIKCVAILRRLMQFAKSEKSVEIPSAALRYAKALARSRLAAEDEGGLLRKLLLPLTFDSLTAPLPAGFRNPAPAHRQMLFEAKGYSVDLNVEGEAHRSALIVGQLLRQDPDVTPVEGIQVMVIANGKLVGEARTGRFGEFQTGGLPKSRIDLRFLIDDTRCLEVSVSAQESPSS